MRKNKPLQKPIAIAVEGADYFYFLLHQLKNKAEFEDIQLFDFGGVTQLRGFLKLLRKDRKFKELKSLGIVRDAELDRDAAILSVKSALHRAGFATPEQPNQIVTHESVKVAYLIIPHDEPSGCLENAMLKAHTEPTIASCVADFLKCVDPMEERTQNERAKIAVRSLIASSDRPWMTLGESSNTTLWDWKHDSLRVMIDFIRLLQR